MDPLDREICACFHVPLRKLWHFARREKLQHHSQLTECLGAGTGCGCCEPLLKVIAELAPTGDLIELDRQLDTLIEGRDVRRRERAGASQHRADDT